MSGNKSGNKTITSREYNNLVSKSKTGWAAFYAECRDSHQRDLLYMNAIHDLRLKMEEETGIPEFIENELRDLMISLKKQIECPICYDELDAKDIKFSSCGHKYCGECLSKIDDCAVCRKKIYRKS